MPADPPAPSDGPPRHLIDPTELPPASADIEHVLAWARSLPGPRIGAGDPSTATRAEVVGSLRDPDGRPLAGVRLALRLLSARSTSAPPRVADPIAPAEAAVWRAAAALGAADALHRTALTASDGRFAFTDLPALVDGVPAAFQLWLDTAGYVLDRRGKELAVVARAGSQMALVAVPVIDVPVVVVGPDGEPVPAARIEADAWEGTSPFVSDTGEAGDAHSWAADAPWIRLRPGTWRIRATADSSTRSPDEPRSEWAEVVAASPRTVVDPVTLRLSAVLEPCPIRIEIQRPSGELDGRLYAAAVLLADGEAAPPAAAVWHQAPLSSRLMLAPGAAPGPRIADEIWVDRPGRYLVGAGRTGLDLIELVEVGGPEGAGAVFPLPPLDPAHAAIVRVRGAEGLAPDDVEVALWIPGTEYHEDEPVLMANGERWFPLPASAEHVARAEDPESRPGVSVDVKARPRRVTRHLPRAPGPYVIEVDLSGTDPVLEVEVTAGAGGSDLPSSVWATLVRPGATGWSGYESSYEGLPSLLGVRVSEPGSYTLEVGTTRRSPYHERVRLVSLPVDVAEGTQRIQVTLPPCSSLRVHVGGLDARDPAWDRLGVCMVADDHPDEEHLLDLDRGSAVASANLLPHGRYRLMARLRGASVAGPLVSVPEQAEVAFDLEGCSGVVVEPSGQPSVLPPALTSAGLRAGDRIVAVGDRALDTPSALVDLVTVVAHGPARVTVERAGARLEVVLDLQRALAEWAAGTSRDPPPLSGLRVSSPGSAR